MSSIIYGKNLIVSMQDTPIAAAKSCVVRVDVEMIETCSVNNGTSKEYYPGRESWQVSCDFFVTNTTKPTLRSLVTLSLNGSQIGTAYIKEWTIQGTVGHLSQGSLVFQGTGPYGVSSTNIE